MGGHAAGEVTSALAADVIRRTFYAADVSTPQALKSAFEAASQEIIDYGALNSDFSGMGTTCTAIAIRDNRLWLAHVGDSRAYSLRDGVLEQLSDDQTLHAQLIRGRHDARGSREESGRQCYFAGAWDAERDFTDDLG